MARRVIGDIINDNYDVVIKIRKFKDVTNPFDGYSDLEIYNRYRFPPHVILQITELIQTDIRHATKRSRYLSPLHQVCLCLRYLASNSFQQVVGDTLNVSQSTVNRCIWRTLTSLVKHLQHFVNFPPEHELGQLKRKFYEIVQFPNVIGLIDGTHVKVIPYRENEYIYVNRKSFHSINVQAVCDADGKFIHINAMWPGSAHDSRVFKESNLPIHLEQLTDNGYLLGDSGYPCKMYLLTPFLKPANHAQERYNISHKKLEYL